MNYCEKYMNKFLIKIEKIIKLSAFKEELKKQFFNIMSDKYRYIIDNIFKNFDDSKNSTGFLVAKEWSWIEWAKWPCPKGYHIPTKSDWQTLIDLWKNNNPKMAESWMWKKFSEDLLLPPIGTRQEAAWRAEWNEVCCDW